MRISAHHRGRERPFERERRIVLRRLPAGAVVRRAVATVTPHGAGAGGAFTEAIGFDGASGDWGATKSASTAGVEIDFHARRRVHSLVGTQLEGRELLVDLGGGFVGLTPEGSIGGGGFQIDADGALPGLTVTGLRLPPSAEAPDIHLVRVTSPPSNLTLRLEGGPTFWTSLGDLVEARTTPDFATVLQAALDAAPVEHGCSVVTFVLHSDTIARLDVDLDVDCLVEARATPPGVDTVTLPYAYDGAPRGGGTAIEVDVPAGMAAVAGASSGRVQGGFEPTRVVAGELAAPRAPEAATVSGTAPLAQPVLLAEAAIATSVDLLLAAVTASVTLEVDLLADLDGRPGGTSLLPATARRTLTRDEAGALTWVNVALPAELELRAGRRCWLALYATAGAASWGAAVAGEGPGLHATRDGGLSWRPATGAGGERLAGALRLRHTPSTFSMPVALAVTGAARDVQVGLDRFAPQGGIDFSLDLPELATAVNEAVTGEPDGADSGGELIANGDFADWLRIGAEVGRAETVVPAAPGGQLAAARFGADAQRLHVVATADGLARLLTFDALCGRQVGALDLGTGQATALVLDPAGRLAVVAVTLFDADSPDERSGFLHLVDLAAQRLVGGPIPTGTATLALAASPDGRRVYTLTGIGTAVVAAVDWADLRGAAIGGVPVEEITTGEASASGRPVALATAPDGTVHVLLRREGEAVLVTRGADLSGERPPVPVPGVGDPQDLAVTPSGARVLVAGDAALRLLRATDLSVAGTVAIPDHAARVAVDPAAAVALVARDGPLGVVDLASLRLSDAEAVSTSSPEALAISPDGRTLAVCDGDQLVLARLGPAVPAEWELTAGAVAPSCLRTSLEPIAVLGEADATGPSAISQVVPASGGRPHRFAFAGLAAREGARAEVFWHSGSCELLGSARVGLATLDQRDGRAVALVPHESLVPAPPGAEQAEVRFATAGGLAAVAGVSLSAAADAVRNGGLRPDGDGVAGWDSAGLAIRGAEGAEGATVVHNPGASPAALLQELPLASETTFALELRARAAAGARPELEAAVELRWLADTGAVLAVVRAPLGEDAFDAVAAAGPIPPGAVGVRVAVVVPPGASVEVRDVALRLARPRPARVTFLSQAPGELTVSAPRVALDEAVHRAPPVPADGLCAATPPEGWPGEPASDRAYCACCRAERPVAATERIETAAGRPGSVSPCGTCGAPRVRLGGRAGSRGGAGDQPPPAPAFRSRPSRRAAAAALSLEELLPPLTAVHGISTQREAALREAGVGSLLSLGRAPVALVAELPFVSEAMARRFIEEARRLGAAQRSRIFG